VRKLARAIIRSGAPKKAMLTNPRPVASPFSTAIETRKGETTKVKYIA